MSLRLIHSLLLLVLTSQIPLPTQAEEAYVHLFISQTFIDHELRIYSVEGKAIILMTR